VADVYLDACCFIYLVEGQPGWRTVVEKRIRDLEPASRLVTSQLPSPHVDDDDDRGVLVAL
jgi:hypothetical protein